MFRLRCLEYSFARLWFVVCSVWMSAKAPFKIATFDAFSFFAINGTVAFNVSKHFFRLIRRCRSMLLCRCLLSAPSSSVRLQFFVFCRFCSRWYGWARVRFREESHVLFKLLICAAIFRFIEFGPGGLPRGRRTSVLTLLAASWFALYCFCAKRKARSFASGCFCGKFKASWLELSCFGAKFKASWRASCCFCAILRYVVFFSYDTTSISSSATKSIDSSIKYR